jgi:hypothetical protein
MKTTKLSKVLECVVNSDPKQASKLLHEYIVAESQKIFNDISEEETSDFDETFDESIDFGDKSDDFIDDVETDRNEIDAEETFEDDDLDDAENDLTTDMEGDDESGDFDPTAFDDGDDMDMDMGSDDEFAGVDDVSDESGDNYASVADGMDDIQAAIDALQATFADLMGDADDGEDEFSVDDGSDDEFDLGTDDEMDDEMDDEVEDEGFDFGDDETDMRESKGLTPVKVSTPNGEDNSKSPVGPGNKDLGNKGTPISTKAGTEKAPKPTVANMGAVGAQEVGAKLRPVAKPTNKADTAKSNIGS